MIMSLIKSKISGRERVELEPDKDWTKKIEREDRFYWMFEVHDNPMHLFHPMDKIEIEILKNSGPSWDHLVH
jgi:hypothetical protein